MPLQAQTSASTVVITGRSDAAPDVAGFGNTPLSTAPFQAAMFGSTRLDDAGITRIGGLEKLDASVGSAYNADGYWSSIAVRGYTLDNRFNYRRDGLPINAETAIALDNKDRLELLKGTSGIQAGTSAPGGLVNAVVKRPQTAQRSARVAFGDRSSVLGAVDIGDRTGPDGAFGWRINAAAERLDPVRRDSRGQRSLLAAAFDWQAGSDTLIEAEIESSRQSQPSAAGFSMLGDTVPAAGSVDPRINLNRQPWNLPVDMDGNTGSVRWQQRLNARWQFRAHAMTQRLRSDDRTAFPYGVYDATSYECAQWCDRFAPDGSFTYWQYVSNNERRDSGALDLAFSGSLRTGVVEHTLDVGTLYTRYSGRFEGQIFDIAGPGRIDGSLDTPPSAGFPDANTNRRERSTELYLRDAMRFGTGSSVWVGLRQTQLARSSQRTSPDADGMLRITDYRATQTVPWLAFAQQLTPETLVYTSWGQGLESDVVPNRPLFTNAGQALPALKSRQVEIGIKHGGPALDATLTAFDIERPRAMDLGACDMDDSCRREIDGIARNLGVEGQLALRAGPWHWHLGAMVLRAQRRGSNDPSVNGSRPVNVPARTLRVAGSYAVPGVQGLQVQAAAAAESDRIVLPDDSNARIPGWWQLDLGARWTQQTGLGSLTWRAAVDNATNRRAWQESPYQFGHAYLYPLLPRAWRLSAQLKF